MDLVHIQWLPDPWVALSLDLVQHIELNLVQKSPGPGPLRPGKCLFFRTDRIFMARRPGFCPFFRTEPRFFASHPGKCPFFRTEPVASGGDGAPRAVIRPMPTSHHPHPFASPSSMAKPSFGTRKNLIGEYSFGKLFVSCKRHENKRTELLRRGAGVPRQLRAAALVQRGPYT